MRPQNLTTKIFLYSGLAKETQEALTNFGFLDGQTTSAKLITKNPDIQKRLGLGKKYSREEIFSVYKKVIEEISEIAPDALISIDIYSDASMKAREMLSQAREIMKWGKFAVVKFPINSEGIKALEQAVKEGMRVTMNHCFTQEQAAAVYSASQGAKRGQVFISPRIERVDYTGRNGMDLAKNIIQMFRDSDHHVSVLCTDIGTIDHFLASLSLGADVVSAPLRILKVWHDRNMPVPQEGFAYSPEDFRPIPYTEMSLEKPWEEYPISDELTEMSLQEAYSSWRGIVY